jgi:hypothetical protein
LRASPPSWTACSNPSNENTIPPAGIAIKMSLNSAPLTKKPPPWLKLPPWKCVASSTTMVRIGIRTFHVVSELLTRASQRIPIRLTNTNMNMRTIATTIPLPVRVMFVASNRPEAQLIEDKYWIAASTSIGATLAACM